MEGAWLIWLWTLVWSRKPLLISGKILGDKNSYQWVKYIENNSWTNVKCYAKKKISLQTKYLHRINCLSSLSKALVAIIISTKSLPPPPKQMRGTEPVFVNVLWSPGIDFTSHVARRASTTNRDIVPARQAGNRFLGSLKGLQIRTQVGESSPWGEGEEICRRIPRNFFSSSQFQRKWKSLVFFQSINFLCVILF